MSASVSASVVVSVKLGSSRVSSVAGSVGFVGAAVSGSDMSCPCRMYSQTVIYTVLYTVLNTVLKGEPNGRLSLRRTRARIRFSCFSETQKTNKTRVRFNNATTARSEEFADLARGWWGAGRGESVSVWMLETCQLRHRGWCGATPGALPGCLPTARDLKDRVSGRAMIKKQTLHSVVDIRFFTWMDALDSVPARWTPRRMCDIEPAFRW